MDDQQTIAELERDIANKREAAERIKDKRPKAYERIMREIEVMEKLKASLPQENYKFKRRAHGKTD